MTHPTTHDAGYATRKMALDMRRVIGIAINSDMSVPWTATIGFSINADTGVLEVRAQWESDTDLEEEHSNQAVVVMRADGQHEVPANLSLDKIVGNFTFEGRDYFICTANIDQEHTFLSVLQPRWCSGGFTYTAKMRLPEDDAYVSSYATLLIEDDQDVTQVRFAVYLTFANSTPKNEYLVSIEPITQDQTMFDVEIREVEDASLVKHFTIGGLKRAVAKHIEDQLEDEDDDLIPIVEERLRDDKPTVSLEQMEELFGDDDESDK